jgi:hypothetical protein
MTGSFTHLLSLAVVSIVAFLVADLLKCKPIYELLLARITPSAGSIQGGQEAGDGHGFLEQEDTKTLIELSVQHGAFADGKKISEIDLPHDCLVVAIKRGEYEILPKGSSKILAGDVIVVLTGERNSFEVRSTLVELCEIGEE